MMPFVPLRPRLASPLLFLLVVGGVIAIADYWMRCQPRPAVHAQTETLDTLTHAVIRESLRNGNAQPSRFADCLHEVTQGIGDDWRGYPVLGATRAGLAPTTLLLPDWKHQQAADKQLAAITQAKARLADKLASLDHLPAALLREAFSGRL